MRSRYLALVAGFALATAGGAVSLAVVQYSDHGLNMKFNTDEDLFAEPGRRVRGDQLSRSQRAAAERQYRGLIRTARDTICR
tara:strand:- start:808 stop:1053 length:246 start_codon:yes stop_codon:yes gene_type:complete